MAVPVAIVVGSTIVAAGLFFGLRGREPVAAVPVALAPAPAPAPAPVSATPELVASQAKEAVAYHHGLLRERCPVPAGATGRVTLDVTFDPEGVQRARGMIDDQNNPPGFATCVNDSLPDLRVRPPGATTRVELELRLP
jgi:hypothetical protein